MQLRQIVTFMGTGAVALVIAALPICAQNCERDIANGPFKYAVVSGQPTSFNFVGRGGSAATAFTITAPAGGTVFPAESPGGNCSSVAHANIRVFGVEKVAADGSTVDVLSSSVGQQIAKAFTLAPSSKAFGIGESETIFVTIENPSVSDGNYGSYIVTIKAQAIGSGVGVSSGLAFTLNLQPTASCVDNIPPIVSILTPTVGDQKTLGKIAVQVQASDPTSPAGCASGLRSLTVSVSSAGGTVNNLDIPLTLSTNLPVAAGTIVTGGGVFTPTGGASGLGANGFTLGTAFLPSSPSGIGSYTITATAKDVADNVRMEAVTFDVNYAVAFTHDQCGTDSNPQSCKALYRFTVKNSDGAFIYDETVKAELIASGGSVAGSHSYGTGDPKKCVKIIDGPAYQTKFEPSPGTYTCYVYFLDVDGDWRQQGIDGPTTF